MSANNTKIVIDLPPSPTSDPQSYARSLNQYLVRQFTSIKTLLGGGLRWQNLRAKLLSTTTPSVAGTPFLLRHDLGKVPELFIANLDRAGSVWADASDRAGWTTSSLQLKSSAVSAELTLLVL